MFNKIVVILCFFNLCSCDDSLLPQFNKTFPSSDDFTSLDGKVLGHLNLPEGADCDWNGVGGECVRKWRCRFARDEQSDPHPVCTVKDYEDIVCCTDCLIINSKRDGVFALIASLYSKKNGEKARDSCLEYLDSLPYRCRFGYNSGLSKYYDEENKCHMIVFSNIWNGTLEGGYQPGIEYLHQALLGYGNDVELAKWEASGTIISNKYILTVAHIGKLLLQVGPLRYVALGVIKLTDDPSTWQMHKVKKLIRHPDYRQFSLYNDIALIETEDKISFNENVLPACLPVEAGDDEKATYRTWIQLESSYYMPDAGIRAQTVNVDKISEDECKDAYSTFKTQFSDGIDYNKQLCYGTKEQPRIACKGNSGEPLLMTDLFDCIHVVIGVTSFGRSQCGSKKNFPDVYTRVAYYKPWIESVVWP